MSDKAGNESVESPAFDVTIDAASPPVPTISGVWDNEASRYGHISQGKTTDDTTPTLSGYSVLGIIVRIFATGPDGVTHESGFATVDYSGDWSLYLPLPLNAGYGAYKLHAIAEDAKGQKSELSNIWDLILDTVAPDQPSFTVSDNVGTITGVLTPGTKNTLIYRVLDNSDPTGGNGVDSVYGLSSIEGLTIDLRGLLIGYRDGDDIKDYLSTFNHNGDTDLVIDRDGRESEFHQQGLLYLNGLTTNIDALWNGGHILV